MRIGVLKFGGIGDCVDLYVLANGIRWKHPDATITCYVTSEVGAEILQPPVVDVVRISHMPWHEAVEREAWKFDMFYELRPYVGAIRMGRYYEREAPIVHLKPHFKEAFEKMLTEETNKLQYFGKDLISLHAEAVDIKASYDDVIPIETIPYELSEDDFVTVHFGADANVAKGVPVTKLWYVDRMQAVVDYLSEKGIWVYQIGVTGEPEFEGAIKLFDLHILEVADVLRRSALHIDIEGGMVRLRRLMTRKPSIVLFGPTPISLFGFANNINISADICHPCFWMIPVWNSKCYCGWNRACMEAITVEMVIDKINEILEGGIGNG